MPPEDHVAEYAGRDRAMAAAGIAVVESTRGRAVTTMTATALSADEDRRVSRGSLFTLADAAIAVASNSYGPPALLVHAEVVWHGEAAVGSQVTAHCQVVHRSDDGDSTFESRVTGDDGSLLAIVWGTTRSPRR